MHKFVSVCLLIILCGIHTPAAATPSVGIGTGKIVAESPIQAGNVITLPQIAVYNDGTSVGSFYIELTNNEKQPEHKPNPVWLKYSPQKFELGPGESKLITIQLAIPKNAYAGEYFGYIEAASSSSDSGQTKISAVSAAKLSFTVITAELAPKSPEVHSDIYRLSTGTSLPKLIAGVSR